MFTHYTLNKQTCLIKRKLYKPLTKEEIHSHFKNMYNTNDKIWLYCISTPNYLYENTIHAFGEFE